MRHGVTGRVALEVSHNRNDLIFILQDATIRKGVFSIHLRGQNRKKKNFSHVSDFLCF